MITRNFCIEMYGNRSNGKRHGDVFTSPDIVKYMLDVSGYTSDRDLSTLTVIEPSCGEGEFVLEIISRLWESSQKFHFHFNKAINNCLTCFDIDKEKIRICMQKIQSLNLGLKLDESIFRVEDFLLADVAKADLVIGNPPYVRHEQISQKQKERYRKLFSTFRYRADLYIPFFEKSLSLLNPHGKHCFICSNRWLKNQYGYYLRNMISSSFDLQTIINLEKVNPFQEDVIAYPAISLIINHPPGTQFQYIEIEDLIDLPFSTNNMGQYTMPHNGDWSDTFNVVSNHLKLTTIEELGFKVGIGVATGADKIFIGRHLVNTVERELLLPILTSKDIKGNRLNWGGNYLFNPFDKEGNVINLAEYPKAQAYIKSYKEKLQGRYVAQKNPQNWYRTIDKVYSDLLAKPKILLPDMSANNQILIDTGHFYPHHNLYYITGSDINDLKILSAFLMSDFAVSQLSRLTNNMNGGYPRWQSQYIRKLKIPDIYSMDNSYWRGLISYYDSKDLIGINSLINKIVM